MSDLFAFVGTITSDPPPSVLDSGAPSIRCEIDEEMSAYPTFDTQYVLTSDAPLTISLGGVVQAMFLFMKGDNSFTASITNANHTAQQLDGTLVCVESQLFPITVVQLTRQAGIQTTVRVVAAQSSP